MGSNPAAPTISPADPLNGAALRRLRFRKRIRGEARPPWHRVSRALCRRLRPPLPLSHPSVLRSQATAGASRCQGLLPQSEPLDAKAADACFPAAVARRVRARLPTDARHADAPRSNLLSDVSWSAPRPLALSACQSQVSPAHEPRRYLRDLLCSSAAMWAIASLA